MKFIFSKHLRINIQLLALGFLFIACQNEKAKISFGEVRNIYKSVSPTIQSISKMNKPAKALAIDRLIKKGKESGFPLIETDSLFPDYNFVTFIFIDTAESHQLSFDVFGIYDEYRFGDRKLHRLDSSEILYRSYMMPNDICFSYRYQITDSISNQKQYTTDPLNQNLIPSSEKKEFSWSVLDLRTDETQWYTKNKNKTGSTIETFQIYSNILQNKRNIYVYLPENYSSSHEPYPVLYLFDSFIYLNRIEVPNVLDKLTQQGRIDPMLAVFIDNPTHSSRKYELPMNPLFKEFMLNELLPAIRSRYNITDKPENTLIGGMSYGGLAATYLAFECDSVFGNVLSQSGSFWRDTVYGTDVSKMNRTDFLINRFLTEEKKDIKLFLDWGLQENMVFGANRKFVRVLDRLGYLYNYNEFNGWHDWSNSRKTFPEGLLFLRGNN